VRRVWRIGAGVDVIRTAGAIAAAGARASRSVFEAAARAGDAAIRDARIENYMENVWH
jgi:hypothetical protein